MRIKEFIRARIVTIVVMLFVFTPGIFFLTVKIGMPFAVVTSLGIGFFYLFCCYGFWLADTERAKILENE